MRGVFYCDLSETERNRAAQWSRRRGVKARAEPTLEKLLTLIGRKPNLTWFAETSLKNGDLQPINELTEDLLAVAAHVYQADRLVRRPEGLKHWVREIELHIGVHNKNLWQKQALELGRILSKITHDQFRLRFYPLPPGQKRPSLNMPAILRANSGICVFSSHFVPVFGIARESTANDLVASVRYDPASPKERQQRILQCIRQMTNDFPYFAFRLHSRDNPCERTQRTSGFLQFSLAAALARSTGLNKIRLFGDCVSSYHLQTRQICGPGFFVHDTRPDFLHRSRDVFRNLRILQKQVDVENPYQFSTAVEVLGGLRGPVQGQVLASLLQETDSCLEKPLAKKLTTKSWDGRVPHCGCCFPCKMRRLAALGSGLESSEDLAAYAIDPLNPQISGTKLARIGPNLQRRVEVYHGKGLLMLKHYLGLFDRQPLDPNLQEEVNYLKAPQFIMTAAAPFVPNTSTAPQQHADLIVEVHKRFWNQIRKYLP